MPYGKTAKEIDFDAEWAKISPVVTKILNMNEITRLEWYKLFQNVYNIFCWIDTPIPLISYEFNSIVKEYFERVVDTIRVLNGSELLNAYIDLWNRFYPCAEYLHYPFHLLDGKASKDDPIQSDFGVVKKLLLGIWRDDVYCNIECQINDSIVDLLKEERMGQLINQTLITGVRETCAAIDLVPGCDHDFLESFNNVYTRSLRNFYQPLIPEYIEQNGIREYMLYASKRISEEEERAQRYLSPELTGIATEICDELFVTNCLEEMSSELAALFLENDQVVIKSVAFLFPRTEKSLQHLLTAFEDHVHSTGLDNIRKKADVIGKDGEKYVEFLIDLFTSYTNLVTNMFHDHPRLLTARDKGYRQLVNNTTVFATEIPTSIKGTNKRAETKCPDLLANYCDTLLRKNKSNKCKSPEEIESSLGKVLTVLKYVENKDTFIRSFKHFLCRRLLADMSCDAQMEEDFIDRLREAGMPTEDVKKMGRMLKDVNNSTDLTGELRQLSSKSSTDSSSLKIGSIHLLIQSGDTWFRQAMQSPSVTLPGGLEEILPEIENFYKRKFANRHLVWQHHLSRITVLFKQGSSGNKVELELTTYQFVVLYTWHRRYTDSLDYDSLKTATGLNDHDLRLTLWSLVDHPKFNPNILTSQPKASTPSEITDQHVFKLNLDFPKSTSGRKSEMARRKVNLIRIRQLVQEKSKEEEDMAIVELRRLRVQEGIVKLLKARKRCAANELHNELVELLSFQFMPAMRLFKEVLEWLIERNYILRVEGEREMFEYIA